MSRLRLGILGTGRIAGDYLAALEEVPELELAGLCDLLPERVAALGERFGAAQYSSLEAMLAAGSLDAVLVATPPKTHESLAVQCLAAGLHVLCEKPFALGLAAAKRMLSAAKRAQRTLTMSAKFRHVPDVIEAKAKIEAGALGKLVLAENSFTAPVPMQGRWNADPDIAGGGVLIDNGTHSVDLMRYLFGEIRWIEALPCVPVQELPVEDGVRLLLGWDSGLLGHVDLSWSLSKHSAEYLLAHGDLASLGLGWAGSWKQRRGDSAALAFGSGYAKRVAFVRQLGHFARLALGEEPALITEQAILASVAVVECGYRSLAAGGARVSVPIAQELAS
ncbi:MAG: oxidoreductase [Planctomycetota bacterium]|nr:MAG: oxidoreductase [Planctomycetota bacterium]